MNRILGSRGRGIYLGVKMLAESVQLQSAAPLVNSIFCQDVIGDGTLFGNLENSVLEFKFYINIGT